MAGASAFSYKLFSQWSIVERRQEAFEVSCASSGGFGFPGQQIFTYPSSGSNLASAEPNRGSTLLFINQEECIWGLRAFKNSAIVEWLIYGPAFTAPTWSSLSKEREVGLSVQRHGNPAARRAAALWENCEQQTWTLQVQAPRENASSLRVSVPKYRLGPCWWCVQAGGLLVVFAGWGTCWWQMHYSVFLPPQDFRETPLLPRGLYLKTIV